MQNWLEITEIVIPSKKRILIWQTVMVKQLFRTKILSQTLLPQLSSAWTYENKCLFWSKYQ